MPGLVIQYNQKEGRKTDKTRKKNKKMMTVYFCEYDEPRGKKTGSAEEIKAIVESWKSNGFNAYQLKADVWVIMM